MPFRSSTLRILIAKDIILNLSKMTHSIPASSDDKSMRWAKLVKRLNRNIKGTIINIAQRRTKILR